MYFVYILESQKNGRHYIGSTDYLIRKFHRHQNGGNKSTKPHRPWTLIYFECCETRSEAQTREYQIKSWKSKKVVCQLIEDTNSASR